MNQEQALELAPVMQAFGEGKKVQWDNNGEWFDYIGKGSDGISFCHPDTKWRVKPEPLELWVNVDPINGFSAWKTKDRAETMAEDSARSVAVHMIEAD